MFDLLSALARWGALLAPLSPASMRNLFIATTVGFGALFLFGRMGEVVRPARFADARSEDSAQRFVCHHHGGAHLRHVGDSRVLRGKSALVETSSQFSGRVRSGSHCWDRSCWSPCSSASLLMTLFRRNSHSVIVRVRKIIEGRRFIPARLTEAVISILEQLAKALRVLVNARELAVTIGWTIALWVGIGYRQLACFPRFRASFWNQRDGVCYWLGISGFTGSNPRRSSGCLPRGHGRRLDFSRRRT